jgi:hypothetical protein
MNEGLSKLRQKIPPPAKPRNLPVNWENIESALGLTYPTGFKELLDVYGGSVWFDHWDFFFRQGKTKKEASKFPDTVIEMCATDSEANYDEYSNEISPPFYPEEGGLLPFLVDYGGCVYYWDTKPDNPDEWPIVESDGGWMTRYPPMSIPTMILKYLERDPQMIEMWGDVEQLPPERIGIR